LRQEDGSYRLSDEGSVAGTWINYTPVSHGGARLEHGDLIHVGRIGFRFTLREPARLRKPVIIAEKPPAAAETLEAETRAAGPDEAARPVEVPAVEGPAKPSDDEATPE
jgi:predicted component of type VI protein secretion system